MVFGIIGALDEEVGFYISGLADCRKTELIGFTFYSGKLCNKKVVVVKSGAGKVNSAICAQLLISKFGVSSLIFTGVAGALNPALDLLDVVISKDCVQHDVDATTLGFKKGEIPFSGLMFFNASQKLVNAASAAAKSLGLKAIVGRILTGDQFVSNKTKSVSLRQEFEGDCVDMESAAVAHVCELNSVPFLVIRSVSDKADHSAPVNFSNLSKAASKNSFLLVKKIVSDFAELKSDFDVRSFLKSKIRTVPDWPKKGIMFRDVSTLLKDKGGFNFMVDLLVERYKGMNIDLVAGVESRGFIVGAVLANRLGVGFVLIRKAGKLPAETVCEEYDLEYGKDKIEIHKDAFEKGAKVLLVDDLIATGGTALAACRLVEKLGGEVVEVSFIVDLPDLGGKKKLEKAGFKTFSLVDFEGE